MFVLILFATFGAPENHLYAQVMGSRMLNSIVEIKEDKISLSTLQAN